MSRNLALLLLAVGWLSAVSARPYGYKQDADKQSITYLPYPSQQDQNTNEQGFRFTYPQTQSTTAEKEGSVSFDWAKQQYMPQAEEEGIRYNFQYPFKNQATAKQQILRYPLYSRSPFARKSGISIGLPQQQAFGYNQGLRLTLPQKQESSEEQSYSFQWPQQQGITIPYSQETARKEGFTYYPQVQENDAEKQRIGISVRGWLQGQEQSQTGEEQRIGFSYHWPQSKQENAKEEGITFTYPQKQTSTAEKERNTAEAQHAGITINWPQQLQKVTKEDLSEIIEKLLAEQE